MSLTGHRTKLAGDPGRLQGSISAGSPIVQLLAHFFLFQKYCKSRKGLKSISTSTSSSSSSKVQLLEIPYKGKVK